MFTFPFGAPVPLVLDWPSGVGVQILSWAACLGCVQLGRFATHAALRHIKSRTKIFTPLRGRKPVPRVAA